MDILSPGLKHPNVMVRCNTIWLLGQIQKPDANLLLLPMLQDKSPEVRIAAVKACQPSLSDANVKAVLPMLKDKSPDVRTAAVSVFYNPLKTKDMALRNNVLKALRDAMLDPTPMVRRYAVYGLVEKGDTAAIPDIMRLLEDSNEDVRQATLQALDKMGDAQAVPALEARLKKAPPKEKETIARLIKKLSQN